jgi:hypothetical protein
VIAQPAQKPPKGRIPEISGRDSTFDLTDHCPLETKTEESLNS